MSVGMAALQIGLVMLCSGLGRVACFAPPRLPAAIRLGPTGHAAPSLHTRSERPRSACSAFSRRGQAVVALAAGQRDGEKPRAVGMQELLADPEMMRAMQVKCHMQLAFCRARAPSFARACFLMHPRRGTEPEGDAGDDGAADGGGHVEVRKRPRSHMVPREIEGPDAGRCSSRGLCRGDALRRPWPPWPGRRCFCDFVGGGGAGGSRRIRGRNRALHLHASVWVYRHVPSRRRAREIMPTEPRRPGTVRGRCMMCCVAQDNAQQLVLLAGDARPITCVMNHYQHCKSASSRQRMSSRGDTEYPAASSRLHLRQPSLVFCDPPLFDPGHQANTGNGVTKPGLNGGQPLQLPEEAVRRKLSGHARTRVPMSHCSRRFPAWRSRRAHAFAAPHLPSVRPYHLSLNPATLTHLNPKLQPELLGPITKLN